MRRMRVAVVMVMFGTLVGCGGSDEPDPGLAERGELTKAAAVEAFSKIGEAVKAASYTSTGAGRWAVCGLPPSPTGAEYVAEVAVTQAGTSGSEQADLIVSALTAVGWKVEPPTSEVVKASKDGLALRAEYGGAINLSVRGGCIDASKDVITKLTDEPRDDLGLQPPS